MRFPAFAILALLGLSGSPAMANVAVGDDWSLTSGLNGSAADGYLPRTTAPVLKAGTGTVAGMRGSQAIYLQGSVALGPMPCGVCSPQQSFIRFGGLERHFSLEGWGGRHLRLFLRLKNDAGARAWVGVQVNSGNTNADRYLQQWNAGDDGAWHNHSYVLAIPDNAVDLVVMAGFTGEGTVWLDGLTLETADAAAPVARGITVKVNGNLTCDGPVCRPIALPIFRLSPF